MMIMWFYWFHFYIFVTCNSINLYTFRKIKTSKYIWHLRIITHAFVMNIVIEFDFMKSNSSNSMLQRNNKCLAMNLFLVIKSFPSWLQLFCILNNQWKIVPKQLMQKVIFVRWFYKFLIHSWFLTTYLLYLYFYWRY